MHSLQMATFGFVFGQYLLQIERTFGWSRFAIAGAFSVSQLAAGILSPAQGWLLDRFGPRAVGRVGVILFGAGFVALSAAGSYWTFLAAVVVMAVASGAAGFLTLNVALANWFQRKRAFAMGISSVGLGLGGVLAPIVAWSLVTYGWRPTAFGSGVAVILIGLPLVQLLRTRPEDYGLLPDGVVGAVEPAGSPTSEAGETDVVEFTVGEALRDRSFWLVSVGHGVALMAVFGLMVHLVPHLVDGLGWSETSAQAMFTLMTVTSIAGQVGGGFLGDRYSKIRISGLCMLGHAIGLGMFAFGETGVWVGAAAVLHGLAWGARGPLMMAIRADYYGRRRYGTIMGYSLVLVMIGPLLGPAFAGGMSDAFGDYRGAFTILGVLAGAGSLLFFLARRPPLPRRLRATAESA